MIPGRRTGSRAKVQRPSRGQSFYRLSKDSGVDQATISRARQVDAKNRRTGFNLTSENLLRLLIATFEPEMREFVGKVETAARKRPK